MRVRALSLSIVLFLSLSYARCCLGRFVLEIVAAAGQEVPQLPGVVFARPFNGLLINDRNQVLFTSLLEGDGVDEANNSAVFLADGQEVRLIAREGSPVPGLEPRVVLGTLVPEFFAATESGQMTALNNQGRFLFVAEMTGPDLEYPATLGLLTGTSPVRTAEISEAKSVLSPAPGAGPPSRAINTGSAARSPNQRLLTRND